MKCAFGPACLFTRILLASLISCAMPPSNAQLADGSGIDDARRALMVRVAMNETGAAELVEVFVSNTPPGTSIAEPPQLQFDYLDVNGNLVGTRNAWDPRLELQEGDDGNEEQVTLARATGVFGYVYHYDIASIRVTDLQTTPESVLLDADVQAVVRRFCIDNPLDPNCDGFVPGDLDGDGIPDLGDNCVFIPNIDQEDLDADGAGDACDTDDDGDDVEDALDNCPLTPNNDQMDFNGDGVGDACIDTDSDGLLDNIDACPVEDATGFDVDSDGCIDSFGGLEDLVARLVIEGVIDSNMETSLLAKVGNAEKTFEKEHVCTAVNELNAFANQVDAQAGKKISTTAAADVKVYAVSIAMYLESRLGASENCR